MASLGQLVVTLAADTARFQGDLGKAAVVAESRMRNIRDTATKALGALTIAATAAGAALVQSFRTATQRADEMTKLASATGTTVESLSRLSYAADLSGVKTEQLRLGLSKLAKTGKGDTVAALLQTADQFASMEDGAEKTALAVKLFGDEAGPRLIPLLNQGSAGIKAMGVEADKLGVTISTNTGRASEQFNDNLTRLGFAATGFGNVLAEAVLPTMVSLTNEIVNTVKNTDAMDRAARAAATGLRIFLTAGELVRVVFSQIGQTIGALAAALVAVAQGQFSQAADIIAMRYRDLVDETQSSATRILDIWDDAAEQAAKGAATVAGGATGFIRTVAESSARTLADVQAEIYADLADNVRDEMERTMRGINTDSQRELDELQGRWEKWKDATGQTIDELTPFADQAARNMQDAFADFLFDPFENGIKGMLKGFVDILRRMVAEAAAAKIFEALGFGQGGGGGGGLLGGLGNVLRGITGPINIPGRALGGPVTAGAPYIVGERGPELFVPRASGSILPNGRMGGASIVINNNIDARGATSELINALPEILRRNNAQVREDIIEGLRRGRY